MSALGSQVPEVALPDALRVAVNGPVGAEAMEAALCEATGGGTDDAARGARLAALLGILVGRGVHAEELGGLVAGLRRLGRSFEHDSVAAIDTCGTGGDGLSTFNVSTATALLVASLGVPVIKHGNRAVSSTSGSADLLEGLGIAVDVEPEVARQRLDATGFTFLFAPRYHAPLGALRELRRALGVPTAINLAAPLANPGRVRRQLVGVADARALEAVRGALERGGTERGFVVHAAIDEPAAGCVDGRVIGRAHGLASGADELLPCGVNTLLGVGELDDTELDPRELGIERCDVAALSCSTARESVRIVERVFDGERGPARDAVVLNAAAALVVAGVARDFVEGAEHARAGLDRGAARQLVRRLNDGGVR